MRRRRVLLLAGGIVALIAVAVLVSQRFYLLQRFTSYNPTLGRATVIDEAGYAVDPALVSSVPYREVRDRSVRGGDVLAVLFSGDGGWGLTENPLGKALAAHGIPVLGVNSLRYFRTPKTPAQAANDTENLIRYYSTRWQKRGVVLIGYSYGADILPFVASRLSPDLMQRVRGTALLGPDDTIAFSISGLAADGKRRLPVYSVKNEVTRRGYGPIICFYGVREANSLCRQVRLRNMRVLSHVGGHRIEQHYAPFLDALLRELRTAR